MSTPNVLAMEPATYTQMHAQIVFAVNRMNLMKPLRGFNKWIPGIYNNISPTEIKTDTCKIPGESILSLITQIKIAEDYLK